MPSHPIERLEVEQAGTCPARSEEKTSRETLAQALAASEGVDPFALVRNTLEEEPCDGFLPLWGEAHFAWRERLGRVEQSKRPV